MKLLSVLLLLGLISCEGDSDGGSKKDNSGNRDGANTVENLNKNAAC